jgi:hypothetical protein
MSVFDIPAQGLPHVCVQSGCRIERYYDSLRMKDVFVHVASDGTRETMDVSNMLAAEFDDHLSVERVNAWIRSLHPEEE